MTRQSDRESHPHARALPRHALIALPLIGALSAQPIRAQAPASDAPQDSGLAGLRGVTVDVEAVREQLVLDEDTDHDRKITVNDARIDNGPHGDRRFRLVDVDGRTFLVRGTYYLSNLLQELSLAVSAGDRVATLSPARIFENPVDRISRSIRTIYWDGLTRRIDESGLARVLVDEKVDAAGEHYLYVPFDDSRAYEYFTAVAARHPELRVRVERLPENVTPEYVRALGARHGLLTLGLETTDRGTLAGRPFVVPGGRFNEMYGWDSYFEILGLLADGRIELARSMVDNFVYQIDHYGKILNANRTYYLTRSQPPFLTSAALAVVAHLPDTSATRAWLATVTRAAIREYETVWMGPSRLTNTGLSRYFGSGLGPPPEVEPGHFDPIYRPYADALGLDVRTFESRYRSGDIRNAELDAFFVNDRCVRESGHDTTYRWESNGDRCADFVTVDLNSLLYKIETDLADIIERYFDGRFPLDGHDDQTPAIWRERAARRKTAMTALLWDEERGAFFDYDTRTRQRHPYVSATSLYPLWAGLATDAQAKRLVETVLPALEMPGGIAASAEASRGPLSAERPARQWDYPNGWAPHQMLIWQGLANYGYTAEADRLTYRWLYTITGNAVDYNGTIPEKYDVVERSHDVFAEYGNVGTAFAYITKEGFGWMNASYQVGLARLPEDLRRLLSQGVAPEWIFR